MFKIFILFLLLLAGIIAGPMLANHQGYVLIQTTHYNIETTVTGLVIMLILLLIVLFCVEWLLRKIFTSGARTRRWFSGRRLQRARRQTNEALLKLAEGDHHQAEKLLTKNAEHADKPVANYLLAAEAAQQRGDELSANQHLARASELADADPIPLAITRVRLQLARNEDTAARRGVDKLLEIAPRHPEVLRLAEQAYLRTASWHALLDILPPMLKTGVITQQQHDERVLQAWIGLMEQAATKGGSAGLHAWWQTLDRKTRRNPALQVAMADRLINGGDSPGAQQIILDGLKRQYDEKLVLLMPRLQTDNPQPIEQALRQQIKRQGDIPLLWSTLGQMLMKHAEWREASLAFRAALRQRPDPFDYAWLADVLEKLGQSDEAAALRRDGLLLTLKNNPDAS